MLSLRRWHPGAIWNSGPSVRGLGPWKAACRAVPMTTEQRYRGMDRAALDAAYNNSAAVRDSAAIVAEWDRRSAAFAASHAQHLDLHYGPRERNRIDYFPATSRGGPVLVFIHGGYWQMRAKESFRFVA